MLHLSSFYIFFPVFSILTIHVEETCSCNYSTSTSVNPATLNLSVATHIHFVLTRKMSDLPENLQIKRELSPPTIYEDKSPTNIKAKLNLHVKRRLQDLNLSSSESAASTKVVATDIKQEQKSEAIRQKRPYHKKTEKNKSVAQPVDSLILASSPGEATNTHLRKYKHKIKQIVATENQEVVTEDNATFQNNTIITSGAISAGDEDDVAHDQDLKAGREKEKCPDILGMVLSIKKRSIMQDPEVQHFFKEIMDVMKN